MLAPTAMPTVLPVELPDEDEDLEALTEVEVGDEVAGGMSEDVVGLLLAMLGGGPSVFVVFKTLHFEYALASVQLESNITSRRYYIPIDDMDHTI